MRSFTRSVVQRHALACALVLSNAWERWQGDCDICGAVDAVGFCDRCTDCAIDSVYSNEEDHGGTSEYVRDALGIPYGSGRCLRLLDRVVELTMEYQAKLWRGVSL